MRKYAQKRQFVQSKKIPRGKVPKLRRLQFQTVCVSSNCLVSKSSPTPLRTQGLQPARLLCPWDFPGKNTGVGCHFLLQGIFLTQGFKPRLLHWQINSLPSELLGKPSFVHAHIRITPPNTHTFHPAYIHKSSSSTSASCLKQM